MEEEFKRLDAADELWAMYFASLATRSKIHPFTVGDSGGNKPLNRYLDVKTFDQTRVKLMRDVGSDYINANIVTVPKAARKYILTQGPLPHTLSHFWLMVWEQKSNIIVMLNRIVEMENYTKCEQYWPNGINETVNHDDVELSVTLDSIKETKHYTVRRMTLKDHESDKSRTITQFHYTAWPDHGQPESPTSILRLLSAVRQTGGLDKMDEPTVVHCSAGIGRSGTFCLIDSILTMVENQGSTEGIDIGSTLVEMRDHRMGLIQSPIQLRFSYLCIICGVKILEKNNKLQPHLSSIKDSRHLDNKPTEQPKSNGANQNGKKSRRAKKKNNHNTGSLNIFKRHLLVAALEDIDSDSADSLYYDFMRPLPNMKKPRTDIVEENPVRKSSSSEIADVSQTSVNTKAQLLKNAINTLLAGENTISANNKSSIPTNTSTSQTTDSVLLRRRERELRNQKINENIKMIKQKMQEAEIDRENYAKRINLLKKSAVYGGVAAIVVSSVVYYYLH